MFFEALLPLTKRFTMTNGVRDVTPYPMVSNLTSHEYEIHDIEQFGDVLQAAARRGWALAKGLLSRPIDNESRSGLTLTDEPTWFLCLDFDGMTGFSTFDEALEALGFGGVSYVLQVSASHLLKPGLNAHVFILLSRPHPPNLLKPYLKLLNLTVVKDKVPLTLTASKMALRWPLDITTCQNDKLIYIAPPLFEGLPDPMEGKPRIQVIPKPSPTLDLQIPDLVQVPQREQLEIEQLRDQAGLPHARLQTRFIKSLDATVMRNPTEAQVTGVKVARGFVYLNINGGDSWGYFHKECNADVVHNFKGEPSYKTEEWLPTYYEEARHRAKQKDAEVKEQAHTPVQAEGDEPVYFVFNDLEQSRYYKACFDPSAHKLSIWPASDLKRIEDFCLSHKLPVPDLIPDWKTTFDPRTTQLIDTAQRTLNLYAPTKYKLQSTTAAAFSGERGSTDHYDNLILHAMGGSAEAFERFLNWLAFIWQTGEKPKTAWVLHGTTGTGKGLLQRVLGELFGQQLFATNATYLMENFNTALRTTQLLWIDESDTDSVDSAKLEPKLKTWITEDTITIRDMYRSSIQAHSFMGVIFASNMQHTALIQLDDRRYNVAPRQDIELNPTDAFVDALFEPKNLFAFARRLSTHVIDHAQVRRPLKNQAREEMQLTTVNLPDEIVFALKEGSFDYFLDYLPIDESHTVTPELLRYRATLTHIHEALSQQVVGSAVSVALTRDHLQTLFAFIAGWSQPPGKFAKSLKRHGVHLNGTRVRFNDRVVSGAYFTFTSTPEAMQVYNQTFVPGKLKVVRPNPDPDAYPKPGESL